MFKWYGHRSLASATRISAFAAHLRDGRIMASRCTRCGTRAFPPRADCDACMGGAFEFVEISGRGHVHTFTTIQAPPRGFEAWAPYRVGVVDLEEGGRVLAWFGDAFGDGDIAIGMPVQIVPRVLEAPEDLHVVCTIEPPGTTWSKRAARPGAAAVIEEESTP